MDAGIFHDAHEVYARTSPDKDWSWLATFSSRRMAEAYTRSGAIPVGVLTEVRPV